MFEPLFVSRIEGDQKMALATVVDTFENMAVGVKPCHRGTVCCAEHDIEGLFVF